ncbi:Uncharacterised protein [uncultured archaeon]|nr:Uncharacterised protein [uncultured archaeon]
MKEESYSERVRGNKNEYEKIKNTILHSGRYNLSPEQKLKITEKLASIESNCFEKGIGIWDERFWENKTAFLIEIRDSLEARASAI